MGEKFEDLVAKICHLYLVMSSRMDFQEFVVTSQGVRKWMAESNENVEVRLSYDNSSYDECYLSVYDSEEYVYSGSVGQEDGVSSTDTLGVAPYQLGRLATL